MATESEIAVAEAERLRRTKRIRELADHSNEASIKRYAVKTGNPIYYSHDDIIKIIRKEFKDADGKPVGVRKDYIPIIRDNPDYVLGRKGGKLFSREHNIKYLMDRGYTKAQLSEVSDVDIAQEANDRRGEVERSRKDRLGRTVRSTEQIIASDLGKTKGSVDDLAKSLATRSQARVYAKTTFSHIENVAERDALAKSKAIKWWNDPVNGIKNMPDGDEWRKIAQQIKDHNDQIIRNYAQAGQVAPKSELLQAHHLQPLGYGGGNSPHNIRAVLGDVLQSPESRHALLHPDINDPKAFYNKVYSMLQKKGHDISAFIPDDPNLRGDNARYLQSVLSDISGGGGKPAVTDTTVRPRGRIPGILGAVAAPALLLAGMGIPGRDAWADTATDPYYYADMATGVDTRKLLQDIQSTKAEIGEARKKSYADWQMEGRHRQRRKELKGQGLLGLNI